MSSFAPSSMQDALMQADVEVRDVMGISGRSCGVMVMMDWVCFDASL